MLNSKMFCYIIFDSISGHPERLQRCFFNSSFPTSSHKNRPHYQFHDNHPKKWKSFKIKPENPSAWDRKINSEFFPANHCLISCFLGHFRCSTSQFRCEEIWRFGNDLFKAIRESLYFLGDFRRKKSWAIHQSGFQLKKTYAVLHSERKLKKFSKQEKYEKN